MRRLAESLIKAKAAFRQTLMIASEATPTGDPGQAAFDDPSPGQDLKASIRALLRLLGCRLAGWRDVLGRDQTPHHLHAPSQMLLDPCDESASIMAIPPQQLEAAKEILDWLKQALGSLLIRATGSSSLDLQQIPLCIHEHVSFASPDFFSPYLSPSQDHARHWLLS